MREFTLLMDPHAAAPCANCAFWSGGDVPAGAASIDAMLDERLLQLRKSHMRWAFAMGKRFGEALEGGAAPSMWWTSAIYERHPRICPYLYTLYKLACVEIWLVENRAEKLVIVGGSARIKRMMAQMCAARGFHFAARPGQAEQDSKQPLARRLYALLPAPLRAMFRLAFWWFTFRRKLGAPNALPPLPRTIAAPKPAATIATYFPNIDLAAAGAGRFRSRYWENLHDALNEQAWRERPDGPHFINWLFIYFQSPGLSLNDCLRLRDSFQASGKDGLSFHFMEEFAAPADIFASISRWLRLCIASLMLQKEFARQCRMENSQFNFWPLLRWHWAESFRGWRCLERCIADNALRRYCQLAGPQRWTLFPLENCPWERMLTEAARAVPRNGPVFGAQHSVIRRTDFRYFDDPRTFEVGPAAQFQPDIIAGNGSAAISQWLDNGMPGQRLRRVEALRYLYLTARKSEARAYLPPSKCLLIVTSFFQAETDSHLALAKEALAAGALNGWQIILKPHPYLMPAAWLESLTRAQRANITLCDEPLELALAGAALVWASNSTTVALEAALLHIPVMVMRARNDFDLCPVQNAPGLLRTSTLADVQKGLTAPKALSLPPDYLDLNPRLTAWRQLLGLESPIAPNCK